MIKMAYKFSPSSLSVLKDCPRCFWLQFNKGIKRPEGVFPSLPGGMDGILKKHFDTFRDRGEMPPELKHLEGEYKLFDNIDLLTAWRNNFQGIQWLDEDGNLFRGAIDNLLQKGDKLVVLDYKTRGYPLKEDTADYYQNQMDIYNLLLRKNGYETEDYAYLLFYHPKQVNEQGDVIFNTDLIRKNIDIRNAEKIFSRAVAILQGEEPAPAKGCKYCGYVHSLSDIFGG
jgi:hypothetical protein